MTIFEETALMLELMHETMETSSQEMGVIIDAQSRQGLFDLQLFRQLAQNNVTVLITTS